MLLAAAGLALAWDVATYDATAWRADYVHLRMELAQGYANLDWMVGHRGLDPVALDAATDRAIADAHSRIRAMLALRDFVEAFDDPHLRLVRRDRERVVAQPDPVQSARPPVASCANAGYSEEGRDFSPAVRRLPGWTPLGGGEFPTGLAGDLGTLCRAVFRPGMDKRALQLAVRARLQQSLTSTISDLQARGARRLLVDVTRNGGGTEWVGEVIALFTDRELSRASSRVVAPACDRSGIWRGEAVCPVFAGAGETSTMQGTGAWTGPVWILMDRRTGSATEDFVVWLQQNGVARTLGERTAGAGCGYVDGGGRIRLRTAPFDVMAPNCARFLRDGTNEVEGIAPDIGISLAGGGDAQQAAALWAAIDAAPMR
jgi:hypothetical protein